MKVKLPGNILSVDGSLLATSVRMSYMDMLAGSLADDKFL